MLLVLAPLVVASAPPLSVLLRNVPLARRSITYYTSFGMSGEFGYGAPASSQWPFAGGRVLELSAGRRARWSAAVDAQCAGRADVAAADLKPPREAIVGVRPLKADNMHLAALAASEAPFDLVFGGHALCTCEWLLDPISHVHAANAAATALAPPPATAAVCMPCGESADTGPCTCGGVPLTRAGVHTFVGGVAAILSPPPNASDVPTMPTMEGGYEMGGIAVFDQEGGWPFGLERLLREAADANGLSFYVRKGPLWTNWDYVLSTVPLEDDVSTDLLQRSARASDAALIAFPLGVSAFIAAARHGDVPRELFPIFAAVKPWVAAVLAVRLLLPFADVLTFGDAAACGAGGVAAVAEAVRRRE